MLSHHLLPAAPALLASSQDSFWKSRSRRAAAVTKIGPEYFLVDLFVRVDLATAILVTDRHRHPKKRIAFIRSRRMTETPLCECRLH
nr:hypothetical protein I308_05610 [Cryptococcus tetragattii IND107]